MGRFDALTFLNVGERAQPHQEISFTASETVSYKTCARVHRKGCCHWAMLSCQKDQALLGLWALTDFHDYISLNVDFAVGNFTQTHVHHVGDAIQSSHPLSSLSPPAFNLSQH